MKIISLFLLLVCISGTLFSQPRLLPEDFDLLEMRYSGYNLQADTTESSNTNREFPEPKSVMFKSLMVPGWGQIQNKQIWKVPIIYGLYAGIGYYTYTVHQDYSDFRAAYYNSQRGDDSDFKFGPTPPRLEGVNSNQLLSNRNALRNRRDLMFVVMVLAHGLNAVDAYVFAHMRSFDVSDDLSARATISPDLIASNTPGIKVSIQLNKK